MTLDANEVKIEARSLDLDCLPFFITAVAAIVVFVTAKTALDALPIVAVELAA